MGARGTGLLENDVALDVVDDVAGRAGWRRGTYVDARLRAVLRGGEQVDADVASAGLAAAALVVASVLPDADLLDEDERDDVLLAVGRALVARGAGGPGPARAPR